MSVAAIVARLDVLEAHVAHELHELLTIAPYGGVERMSGLGWKNESSQGGRPGGACG